MGVGAKDEKDTEECKWRRGAEMRKSEGMKATRGGDKKWKEAEIDGSECASWAWDPPPLEGEDGLLFESPACQGHDATN